MTTHAVATPPRLARALLRGLAPAAVRWLITDDLDEEFVLLVEREGAARARWWYRAQVAMSLPTLLAAHATAVFRRDDASVDAPTHSKGDSMLSEVWSDVRYAARRAWKHPLVACTVIVSTGLGIGTATAVLSVVNGLLIRPLPIPQPDRVVRLFGMTGSATASAQGWAGVSFMNAADIATRAKSFTLALYNQNWSGTLLASGEPRTVQYAVVSNEFASVLGLRTALGRWFSAEEHRPGSDDVAVLTYEGWQREFGGDPSAVGRTMVIDGTPLKIVGVLQPLALEFPKADLAFWTPLAPPTSGPSQWRSGRQSPWLAAVARLRPNVTLEQANAELDVLARQLAAEFPTINKGKLYRAHRLQDALVGPVRPMLWLLAGVVAAVLSVACGNVAMLLRANANARRGEFAVRASLGGTTRRMSQQILTETASLAAVGGLFGVLAAPLIVAAFLRLYPGSLPSRAQIVLDARMVAFALAMISIAALLAGLPVARHATHGNLANRLRDGGGGRASSSRGERRYGNMLIAGQVGFSVVLLFAAGLLIRSFWNLTHVNLGFEPRGVLTFWLTPSNSSRPADVLVSQLEATFRAMPGVRDVATSYDIPTAGRSFGASVLREGKGDVEASAPTADVQMVSPRFFSAMGMPLRAGRDVSTADRAGAPPVVVVNEAFAARMFPGENPLGRRITVWDTAHTIVGIIGDARRARPLWDPPEPEMYFAIDQRGQRWRYVVIRTDGRTPTATLITAVRNEVRRLDPTLAISELAFLDDRLRDVTAPQRFRGALVGAIGALALLLSIIGVYGVVTYTVSRRTREIGIRIALGEAGRATQLAIVGQALRPTIAGVAAGVVVALFVARWLESFVLGISPRDALTLVSVACLFLVVGVLAAYAPARRASRIDPVLTLRGE